MARGGGEVCTPKRKASKAAWGALTWHSQNTKKEGERRGSLPELLGSSLKTQTGLKKLGGSTERSRRSRSWVSWAEGRDRGQTVP